jgi:high-affinity iron transporter
VICLIIGAGMIGAFYGIGTNIWSGAEDIWEGVFALVASIIITLMGAALLRVSKMKEKWRVKLSKALDSKASTEVVVPRNRFARWCEKYALFILPFITVLREGLEAVVFIGGVGVGLPATSFPLAVVCGLLGGALIGYLIYKGGNHAKIQIFLIISTSFLYLVAAGLFSRAVWAFQSNAWTHVLGSDTDGLSSGPGSYDIRQSVWHVNCCNAEIDGGGGWGVFNSLLGWQSSATLGSVISYNLYWLAVIAMFLCMRFHEGHGRWPLMKAKAKNSEEGSGSGTTTGSDEADSEVRPPETFKAAENNITPSV